MGKGKKIIALNPAANGMRHAGIKMIQHATAYANCTRTSQ